MLLDWELTMLTWMQMWELAEQPPGTETQHGTESNISLPSQVLNLVTLNNDLVQWFILLPSQDVESPMR